MLYYLFRALESIGVPGSGLWSYTSFRGLLALMLALIISTWFGEYFIKLMKRKNISETQRDEAIDPFGTQKIECALYGRHHHYYSHSCTRTLTRPPAQYLPYIDDHIDRLVG